jgi:5-formyltetrahydrofolate cyclo-ligase
MIEDPNQPHPARDKPTLRRELRRLLADLPAQERHAKSLAATSLLTSTPEFSAARIVMLYLSTPHELDTSTLALRCWQQGKMVVVPKVSWDQRRMIPVEITSLSDESMTITGPGIREPREANPVPVSMVDIVVVPALGYTMTGHRIGRGMGFYDRFLGQKNFMGVSCGMSFEEQIVHDIPCQDHDVPMSMLVTDRAIRRFKTFCMK